MCLAAYPSWSGWAAKLGLVQLCCCMRQRSCATQRASECSGRSPKRSPQNTGSVENVEIGLQAGSDGTLSAQSIRYKLLSIIYRLMSWINLEYLEYCSIFRLRRIIHCEPPRYCFHNRTAEYCSFIVPFMSFFWAGAVCCIRACGQWFSRQWLGWSLRFDEYQAVQKKRGDPSRYGEVLAFLYRYLELDPEKIEKS